MFTSFLVNPKIASIGYTYDIEARIKDRIKKATDLLKGKGLKFSFSKYFTTKEEAHQRELEIKSWKSPVKIQDLITNKKHRIT